MREGGRDSVHLWSCSSQPEPELIPSEAASQAEGTAWNKVSNRLSGLYYRFEFASYFILLLLGPWVLFVLLEIATEPSSFHGLIHPSIVLYFYLFLWVMGIQRKPARAPALQVPDPTAFPCMSWWWHHSPYPLLSMIIFTSHGSPFSGFLLCESPHRWWQH